MSDSIPKEKRSQGPQLPGDFKISGTGWFCVWHRGEWVVVFKLTDDQMHEYTEWKKS